MHGCRKGIVGALRAIDIVIGMNTNGAAAFGEQLVGAVGHHFVYVHVGLRAAACLPYNKRKMLVPLAAQNLVDRFGNNACFISVKHAKLAVGKGGSFFDNSHSIYNFDWHAFAADFEVLQAALRLSAP
ncbi:hypothetical protein D3C78_1636510 [compost metagenome]